MAEVEFQVSMENELNYFLAEKALEHLWQAGLIDKEESDTIHELNLESFKPYLAELMV